MAKAIFWVEGAPRFMQGHYAPTANEAAVSVDAFNFGALQFFWDRLNQALYFLQFIDGSNNQTWAAYPTDLDSIAIVSLLMLMVPLDDNYTRWAVTDYDPTPNENIAAKFFTGQYGLLFWNRVAGHLFKMTAYSDNGDGTFTQTWTQII